MDPVPLSALLVPLSIAIALWQWARIPRPRPPLYRLLGILILLALCTEVAGLITRYMHQNNTAIYNAFTVCDLLLVLAMIRALRPGWAVGLAAVAIAGLAMLVADWVMHPGTGFMLTEGIVGVLVLLFGCCLVVLWHLAQSSLFALHRVPEFWLFMGLLVYFGGVPPMMAMVRYIYVGDPELAERFYAVIPALCMIRYLLTAVSCGMMARNAKGWSAA